MTAGILLGSIIVTGILVRRKGYSKNKFLSNVYSVPYVDPKYMDLEEQTEVEETADGIVFR